MSQLGKTATEMDCPRHVGFTPVTARIADIAGGPVRANNRNALIRSPDLRGRVTTDALGDPRRFAVVIATQLDNQANLRFIKGCAVGPIFFDRLNNLLSRLL